MSREPILVPAWPAVLRAGLYARVQTPTGVGPERVVVFVGHSPDGEMWAHTAAMCESPVVCDWPVAALRLDLRDPAVRDAVVRAMWRKLRPTEPELLTAPTWACNYGPGMVPEDDMGEPGACWYLGPDGAALTFVDAEDGPVDDDTVFVDGLEDIARACAPDRDLLALAACAAAVLGGA